MIVWSILCGKAPAVGSLEKPFKLSAGRRASVRYSCNVLGLETSALESVVWVLSKWQPEHSGAPPLQPVPTLFNATFPILLYGQT
jgi:hypothetical protein